MRLAGADLGAFSIRSLALSGSTVIVGTDWEGVWRSPDEGRTWRVITAGLSPTPHVNALVVDPQRSEAATTPPADTARPAYAAGDGRTRTA